MILYQIVQHLKFTIFHLKSPQPHPSRKSTTFLDKLEALSHLAHQLFLALVSNRYILDQPRKVSWSIPSKHKCVTCLAQKVYKVAVVTWGDVRESENEKI